MSDSKFWEYKKACACHSSASGPRPWFKWLDGTPADKTIRYMSGYSFGPVCDACETPWQNINAGLLLPAHDLHSHKAEG